MQNARFAFDHVAAQLVLLEMEGGPTNVKNADLNRMYESNREFDAKSPSAKAVKRVLDIMAEVFPEKSPELERYNVIALYCVISELIRQYVIAEIKDSLNEWFFRFEATRGTQDDKPEDIGDPEWVSYREKISHSTDAADSIRWRMEFLLRNLLQKFPNFYHGKTISADLQMSKRLQSSGATKAIVKSNLNVTAQKLPGITGMLITVFLGQRAERRQSQTDRCHVPHAIWARELAS